jgi:SAM-dependent methyltransferase
MRFVEGDACDLRAFADGEFDVVFSNSVIEHVGDTERQEAFARTVRRLGRRFWVQTPARWFPIEAHTGVPFWWFLPEASRNALLRRWHRKLPAWSDAMAGTRVLTRQRLAELFPGAQIFVESMIGIPKSYAAYTPG